MLRGDLGAVAAGGAGGGEEALAAFRLEVGRPIAPMLASTAPDVEAALEKTGPAAVEWKLDGARIQVHRVRRRRGGSSRARSTTSPRGCRRSSRRRWRCRARSFVLDGEAIALREDGRPYPFQVTGSRFASRSGRSVVLTPMFFDLLHLDGEDLLDRPGSERAAALSALVPDGVARAARRAGDARGRAGAGARGRRREGARRAVRGGAARRRRGSRSSRSTRSTSWCWRSSGARAGGAGSSATCTSARAGRTAAS